MNSKKKHVMFVCTEDWFFQSHFLPLNEAALKSADCRTSVVCNTGKAQRELESMGLNVHHADFSRRSKNPFAVLWLAGQIMGAIWREKPDILHFIALKPVLLGGLVALPFRRPAKIFHVTGMGTLAEGRSFLAVMIRNIAFRLVTFLAGGRKAHLLVENPDDLAFLQGYGQIRQSQVTLLGGAGVDPKALRELDFPKNKVVHIAYVGRMIWTKGVDVLVEAHGLLYKRGVKIQLDLYGEGDPGNPNMVSGDSLKQWNDLPLITWHGKTNDILSVWQRSDIAVVPTRTREGMPRAMLEAASYGRPLVVTDIPGCRHFVRDGIEGLVVPPDDAPALALALEKLSKDVSLRKKMGRSARQRVLEGYTEEAVKKKVSALYQRFPTA